MCPFVHGSQSVPSHVSVNLRGPYIGVTEQLLDHSQIGASLQKMSSKGMPKCVRMQGPAVREPVTVTNAANVAGPESVGAGVQE